jgi:hypothetical protein
LRSMFMISPFDEELRWVNVPDGCCSSGNREFSTASGTTLFFVERRTAID